MINKLMPALCVLSAVALLATAFIGIAKDQNEFRKKCDAIGGVVVESHGTRRYCAKGTRFEG